MTVTTHLDSVTTADAAPAVAPYRISALATKDSATVAFTPHVDATPVPGVSLYPSSGAVPGAVTPGQQLDPDPGLLPGRVASVRAYRVRAGGVDRATGTRLAGRGAVAGSEPCSPAQPCSSFSMPSDTQVQVTLTYSEFAGRSDGSQTISIYANAGGSWG